MTAPQLDVKKKKIEYSRIHKSHGKWTNENAKHFSEGGGGKSKYKTRKGGVGS